MTLVRLPGSDLSMRSCSANTWFWSSPTFDGLTCLSSPTTTIRSATCASSTASSPDWLASSTITTSNSSGLSIGTLATTWCSGMIQAGTASWASRRLCRACAR